MTDLIKQNLLILEQKAEDFNLKLSSEQLSQFEKYYTFLADYNKHTNLVASTSVEDVFMRHFLDSVSIGLLKDKLNINYVIDIGIGGGFPGFPMLIAFPQMYLCGIDSVGKKIKFLEQLAEHLGISERVKLYNGRAEELARKAKHRENYDLAVTRAVGQLALIAEYCLPFVKPNGDFVAYKAKNVRDEVKQAKNALSHLGGTFKELVDYSIYDEEDVERNLILIHKHKHTPPNFPRAVGIPKKKPL